KRASRNHCPDRPHSNFHHPHWSPVGGVPCSEPRRGPFGPDSTLCLSPTHYHRSSPPLDRLVRHLSTLQRKNRCKIWSCSRDSRRYCSHSSRQDWDYHSRRQTGSRCSSLSRVK